MRDRGCIRNIRTWFVDMVLSNSFWCFSLLFYGQMLSLGIRLQQSEGWNLGRSSGASVLYEMRNRVSQCPASKLLSLVFPGEKSVEHHLLQFRRSGEGLSLPKLELTD